MPEKKVEYRRDPRYALREDRAFAEFDDPRDGARWCGRLLSLSAAGIALMVDARLDFNSGTVLEGVTLRVGPCELHGRIVVKNVRIIECEVRSVIGGLFYPGNESESRAVMALIAGMEAVDLDNREKAPAAARVTEPATEDVPG